MGELDLLGSDEVLDLWIDVLHREGLPAINKRLWGDLLDYEWARICDPISGFAYFLRHYGSIRVKGRGEGTGWQRFCPDGQPRASLATGKSWAWQLELAALLPLYDKWAIEKARQEGITFIEAMYALHFAGTKPDQPVLLLSNKLPSAKRLLRRCHHGHFRLPAWLKDRMRMTSPSIELTQFANGSTLEPLSSSSDTGRSEAAGLIIADEWAYVEKQEEVHTSIDAAGGEGGQIIYSSTANGVGDMFYDWCCDGAAGEYLGQLSPGIPVNMGISDIAWTFLPWWAHPDRTPEWREKAARRYKGSYARFVQEYPDDWLEAFITSGKSFHNQSVLSVVEEKAKTAFEPLEQRGTFLWVDEELQTVKFCSDPTGLVTLHGSSEEIEEARHDSRPWVVAADSAGDAPWGDFHAATAWKSGVVANEPLTGEEHVLIPHRQLVTIHGYADADAYAELLVRLGYWTGTSLLVPEANSIGIAVIHYLRNKRYPRIFRRRPTSEKQKRAPQALLGFWSGGGASGTKQEAYGELERMLRCGEVELRDVESIREIRQVRFLGQGRIGVAEPGHDDRADACAMAAATIRFARSNTGSSTLEAPDDPFRTQIRAMAALRRMDGRIGSEMIDPNVYAALRR
jgi:hypothetical protein